MTAVESGTNHSIFQVYSLQAGDQLQEKRVAVQSGSEKANGGCQEWSPRLVGRVAVAGTVENGIPKEFPKIPRRKAFERHVKPGGPQGTT